MERARVKEEKRLAKLRSRRRREQFAEAAADTAANIAHSVTSAIDRHVAASARRNAPPPERRVRVEDEAIREEATERGEDQEDVARPEDRGVLKG
jgi:hypothetical protein